MESIMARKGKNKKGTTTPTFENRRARHDYFIESATVGENLTKWDVFLNEIAT